MARAYSRSADVVDALIKTFDGKHPCTLCYKVKEGPSEGEERSSFGGEQERLKFLQHRQTTISGSHSLRTLLFHA